MQVASCKKLFIGVATRPAACDSLFVQSFASLITNPPCRLFYGFRWGNGLEWGRNKLVADFLKTDCTDILFIDSDIGFAPNDVSKIVEHDVDVVGGIYPLKTITREICLCWNTIPGKSFDPDKNGLMEVATAGNGFLRVSRRAIVEMIERDKAEIEYHSDDVDDRVEWCLFRQAVLPDPELNGRRRFFTEDWFFCRRARDLGFKVYVDTRITLNHAGRAVWPLRFQNGVDGQI